MTFALIRNSQISILLVTQNKSLITKTLSDFLIPKFFQTFKWATCLMNKKFASNQPHLENHIKKGSKPHTTKIQETYNSLEMKMTH